jgi:hypothetical protein
LTELRKRYVTEIETLYSKMNATDRADGNPKVWSTRMRRVGSSRKEKDDFIEIRNGNVADVRAPQS